MLRPGHEYVDAECEANNAKSDVTKSELEIESEVQSASDEQQADENIELRYVPESGLC